MGLTVEFLGKQRVQILGEHIENCYSTIANKQVAVWFGDLINYYKGESYLNRK